MTKRKIAYLLPRNMHFGPQAATSIDLCVRDAVLSSAFSDQSTIVCQEISSDLFEGVDIRQFRCNARRKRISEITEIFRELTPDIIIVHQHLPTASIIAKRFAEIPVLLHRHNFIKPTRGVSLLHKYSQINRLSGIIFVSRACRDQFRKDYRRAAPASYVVHNGLIPEEWPRGVMKEREIVAVGNILPGKGMLEIAGALADVLPQFPGWHGRIIGRRSAECWLNERLKAIVDPAERLSWQGYLPFAEVVQATSRASIAVVNSNQESFGRVAIEAFAAETALVSSTEGGLEEVIGNAALRLQTRDRAEIATAIRTLLTNPDYRKALAREGRSRFESDFTIEKSTAALDAIIEDFLVRRASSAA